MKLFMLLLTAIVIQGEEINDEEVICIRNVQHDIEVLKTDLDRPYSLVVDYSTNVLYFTYSLNNIDDVFKTGYINLNTKEFGDLEGVENGFTQTIDQNKHEIYIGTNNGIYKYEHAKKTAEFYALTGIDIWHIYFKDIIYYSIFPNQFFYTYINGEVMKFKDLQDTKVDQFVIDNEDFMFFTNATGLYGQRKGSDASKLYNEYNTDGIRALTTDINGNVFFCRFDGIYTVDKAVSSVNKVLDLNDVYGLAFDNVNNIIYSDESKIVRLIPKKDKAC
ncbi:unnamed protein product [Danaus chrysippus]|uniref:(African queen) hypothetical protein n=1 Tax=Danaus chrysippus TaxID=151541 RepID=A0A8J2VZH4_9NEOP|nr:unnamed protein product [Danaus chrysippus]